MGRSADRPAAGRSSPSGAAPPAQIEVRVWLFGLIARMAGEREISFRLPAGARLADVMATIERRYGATLVGDLMRSRREKASCCRVSVNGRLAGDLTMPLPGEGASVEIIVLSAYEGG